MLGFARGACVLHEPLNYHGGDRSTRRYFNVVGHDGYEEEELLEFVKRVSSLNLQMKDGIFPGEPLRRRLLKKFVGGRPSHSLWRARFQIRKDHIIWKDPFASFLVDQIARDEAVKVLVTYRPPQAIAASFKRVKWAYSYKEIEAKLAEEFRLSESQRNMPLESLAMRGAFFWLLSYRYLSSMARRYENVRLVNTDWLIQDAEASYRSVYEFLDLPYTTDVQRKIRAEYDPPTGDRPDTPDDRVHTRHRNMKAVNTYWSSILDEEEKADIQRLCEPDLAQIEASGIFVRP